MKTTEESCSSRKLGEHVQMKLYTKHNTTNVTMHANHYIHTPSHVSSENILPCPVVVRDFFLYLICDKENVFHVIQCHSLYLTTLLCSVTDIPFCSSQSKD